MRIALDQVGIMVKFVTTVFLVSCVKQKRAVPCAAKQLYISNWFQKARAYAESAGRYWFILSAEHGLVDPETVTAPYSKTLNQMNIGDRRAWANKVISQMTFTLPPADRIVILAGVRYREFLMDYLLTRARTVEVPMEGLSIGRQLQWMKNA